MLKEGKAPSDEGYPTVLALQETGFAYRDMLAQISLADTTAAK